METGGIVEVPEPKVKRQYKRKVIQDAGQAPTTGRGSKAQAASIGGSGQSNGNRASNASNNNNTNSAGTNNPGTTKAISKRSKKAESLANKPLINVASHSGSLPKESVSDDSSPQVIQSASTARSTQNHKNSLFNPKALTIIDKLGEFSKNFLQNPTKPEEQKKKKKLIEDSEWAALADRKRKYIGIAGRYPYLKVSEEQNVAKSTTTTTTKHSKDLHANGNAASKAHQQNHEGDSQDEIKEEEIIIEEVQKLGEEDEEEELEVVCTMEQEEEEEEDSQDNPQSPSFSEVSNLIDAEEGGEEHVESAHDDDEDDDVNSSISNSNNSNNNDNDNDNNDHINKSNTNVEETNGNQDPN